MQVHVSNPAFHRAAPACCFSSFAAGRLRDSRSDRRAAQHDAEAQPLGGPPRHALRGLEDCYTLNPKAAKASVFAGWKDMDGYMRENKIEGTPSVLGKVDKPERSERSTDIETEPRDATSRERS